MFERKKGYRAGKADAQAWMVRMSEIMEQTDEPDGDVYSDLLGRFVADKINAESDLSKDGRFRFAYLTGVLDGIVEVTETHVSEEAARDLERKLDWAEKLVRKGPEAVAAAMRAEYGQSWQ